MVVSGQNSLLKMKGRKKRRGKDVMKMEWETHGRITPSKHVEVEMWREGERGGKCSKS